MAKGPSLSSLFYRLARLMRDVEVVSSGDTSKMGKRYVNKWIGRNLVRRLWIRK